ncbi:Urease accessory protein UreE [hydrothermal vent metagenome]|uniref:Urease accessory protein UreE n=1 Tax=hydrothermal vent metagenome TaxID=652676 RepID=A0A3B0U2W1_9ZZZZ
MKKKLPVSDKIIRATAISKSSAEQAGSITLTYSDRFRRRVAMISDNGIDFLLDLAEATELADGEFLVLDDGRYIKIIAAKEKLMRIRAKDQKHLSRAAWHVGNRHLACEIHAEFIVLTHDRIIKKMLLGLGCNVEEFEGPFSPEGGAYGQGRVLAHSH